MTKQHQIPPATFHDLALVVEGQLKGILPRLAGAIDQIKADFKATEADSLTFHRLNDVAGEIEALLALVQGAQDARAGGADVLISLPYDQASRASDVADGVFYMLNQASEVFRLLDNTISNGDVRGDDSGVAAVMGLASRALRSMADTEGEIMGKLGRAVQHGLSQHINANLRNPNAKAA